MRIRAWKIMGMGQDYSEEYWLKDNMTTDEIWSFVRQYIDATGWEIIPVTWTIKTLEEVEKNWNSKKARKGI